MSKEFVTVADETYYLYPENPQHLERAKGRPDHEFFKKYGEAMPPGAWNHPGTKQGIYMMGPDTEYLEGRFAAGGDPADIIARLNRALAKWEALRKEKGYANKPIPVKAWSPPPDVEGELILRVNIRDLPRGPGDRSGARRHELQNTGLWMDFVNWAWNENWVAVAKAASFVPRGTGVEQVEPAVVNMIAREVMVDNVRGQAPEWQPSEVKSATMTMKRLPNGLIEYAGSVSMASSARGYDAKLYGQGTWDGTTFTSLDIVAMGTRRGAARFNQRENDPGPAPMGVTLSLRRQ
ncbi:MAG: hypothetical protein WD716_13070 [Fimbriimonadaceae bacterium]